MKRIVPLIILLSLLSPTIVFATEEEIILSGISEIETKLEDLVLKKESLENELSTLNEKLNLLRLSNFVFDVPSAIEADENGNYIIKGKTLPEASVKVGWGLKYSTKADSQGNFLLEGPISSHGEDIDLSTTYSGGTKKKLITVSKDKALQESIATAELEESASSEQIIEEIVKQENLTIHNNEDLATLLNLQSISDPYVKEFANKYAEQIIEFDGNIRALVNHGRYKTRFDILIYVGDYTGDWHSGPHFQFEDVAVTSIDFIGSYIPDYVREGQNYHVVAEVVEYDDELDYLYLKPVLLEYRE